MSGDGAELRLGAEVLGVQTSAGELRVDALVNCAGLHSDRVPVHERQGSAAPPPI